MLINYASNMSLIKFKDSEILFSYSTPVAGRNLDINYLPFENGLFKTEEKFSAITTKHINKYFSQEFDMDGEDIQEVAQEDIEKMFYTICMKKYEECKYKEFKRRKEEYKRQIKILKELSPETIVRRTGAKIVKK